MYSERRDCGTIFVNFPPYFEHGLIILTKKLIRNIGLELQFGLCEPNRAF